MSCSAVFSCRCDDDDTPVARANAACAPDQLEALRHSNAATQQTCECGTLMRHVVANGTVRATELPTVSSKLQNDSFED